MLLSRSDQKLELREYFTMMMQRITSTSMSENAFPATSDEHLKQFALIFAHCDEDSDGVLSPSELELLLKLVSKHSGVCVHAPENIELVMREADVDGNGHLDLNEVLLMYRDAKQMV